MSTLDDHVDDDDPAGMPTVDDVASASTNWAVISLFRRSLRLLVVVVVGVGVGVDNDDDAAAAAAEGLAFAHNELRPRRMIQMRLSRVWFVRIDLKEGGQKGKRMCIV
jgi:hypothetical protein